MKERFDMHSKTGLDTLIFHLSKQDLEDLDAFGRLKVLNRFAFRQLNDFVRRGYHSTLQCQDSALEDTVRVVDATEQKMGEGLVAERKDKRQPMENKRDPICRIGRFGTRRAGDNTMVP